MRGVTFRLMPGGERRRHPRRLHDRALKEVATVAAWIASRTISP